MSPRHLSLAVGLAAIWGVNFVVMQVGLEHFPPLLYASLRFALAAVPAVLLVGRPRVPWRWVVAVAATLGAGQFALLLIGMRAGMPAGLTSLVLQAQVLFTIVFAVTLLGERLTTRRVTGLVVAFGGLALVAYDFGLSGPLGAFALCVAAAAAWGLGNVAQRRAAPPDSLRFMIWVSAFSAPPLLMLSLVVEGVPDLAAPAAGWLSLAYVAFVSTLGGFGIWGFLLRRYDASVVAPYTLLVPVFGMSSAAVLTGEPVSLLQIAAAALIVAGVLYAGTGPRALKPALATG